MLDIITTKPRVLVVGAGAMGIVTGYHLGLAGAAVTFLVRPHRIGALSRPQILYCYDDGTLKTYAGYDCLSDPRQIAPERFDYAVVTLDETALRNAQGRELTHALGDAFRGGRTKVIIGAVGLELRRWFLEASGLDGEQVTNGVLSIMAHPVAGIDLPLHPPTDPGLLAQADLAYVHSGEDGFIVDDSAPGVAHGFADLYDRSGVSRCVVMTAESFAPAILALFPFFTASDIMDWPRAGSLAADAELWALTTAAVREIQGLEAFGDAGRRAREATTPASLLAMWESREIAVLPMDLPAFNRFHHGRKVNRQDRRLLADCVALGEASGQPMTALRDLIGRLDAKR